VAPSGYEGLDSVRPAGASEAGPFVDFEGVLHLFETVARNTDNDALGVQVANSMPIPLINLQYFLIKNAPTLRDALEQRVRFAKFVTNAYSVRLEFEGDTCSFVWDLDRVTGPLSQFVGYAASIMMKLVRLVIGNGWQPLQVDLPIKLPRAINEYQRVLGSRINFGAADTRIRFGSASLNERLLGADPDLYQVLSDSIRKPCRLAAPSRNVVDRTRAEIIKASAFANARETEVASAVGVSVRTLQRELQDGGTSFRALVDETRKRSALQLLHDTGLPLTEVAFLLGFSELSAFSRAARQWFGDSPSNIRKRARDT
jgi:AraC-like DNA-binding protein